MIRKNKKSQYDQQGDPDCPLCEGKGYIPITEEDPEYQILVERYGEYAEAYMSTRRCECLEDQFFKKSVGRAIYNADVIEESQLDQYEEKNLFLQADRPDFLAHLRAFLKPRHEYLSWRMTSDLDLMDIWLGKNEDWPSVTSFLKNPDLAIIQLGVVSYKNVALPGQIYEAIKIREMQSKPTWVINPHSLAFKEGSHFVWSPELEWYLEENYFTDAIKSKRKVKIVDPNNFGLSAPKPQNKSGRLGEDLDLI